VIKTMRKNSKWPSPREPLDGKGAIIKEQIPKMR